MSYAEDENGFCFSKWLALLIALQMTWTGLKQQLKGKKNAFLYFYEERMWYMAAVIDQLTPSKINRLVEKLYREKMKGAYNQRADRHDQDESLVTEIDESMNTIESEKTRSQIKIKTYIECIFEVLKRINPWI